MDLKRIFRGWVLAILFVAIILVILYKLVSTGPAYKLVPTSQAIAAIDSGNVKSVTLTDVDQTIQLTTKNNANWESSWVGFQGTQLANTLQKEVQSGKLPSGVYTVKVPKSSSFWTLIFSYLPFLIIFLLFMVFLNQMQGGGSRVMNFGKSKAKLITKDTPKTTFSDVAGADEAIEELQEIKEFLQSPGKFQAIGAKIPKGVLLYGPPGTGKTLLARAVAGEAGVPFYSISGSDFVEMFVGVGASRVRDLFEQAKANAPAIVFVDEIDAVGRHRGAGFGGGHDEREQTLNQLLVEMDGFESNDGVILVAATNRPDVLDPALLRPGRFDRRVVVGLPDVRGREEVLRVHVKKVPISDDVNLNVLARGTPGFSGADLANMVNEAALNAARANRKQVTMYDCELAKDKVLMGAERKSMLLTDEEKRVTAYHEAGHALVSFLRDHSDPIHKVTIIPRGMALGVTVYLPDDRHNYTREYLETRLATAYGGRVAEEIFLNQMATGAGSDIESATDLARSMVCEYGMSRLGPLTFGKKEEQIFLGREIAQHRDFSEETARQIDLEVRRLIDEAYQSARNIIDAHQDAMHRIAAALLERETIDADEVKLLIEGKELPPLRSSLASPSDTGGTPQQVLKPESRGGPGFPEGSPSPA